MNYLKIILRINLLIKSKNKDKEKSRAIDEKIKTNERLKAKCKDKDIRSRTPPTSERSKHQHQKKRFNENSPVVVHLKSHQDPRENSHRQKLKIDSFLQTDLEMRKKRSRIT